ncbi:MAG TPA: hypothetical protein VGH94_15570, partial [Acidimicrobiales bacterium]
STYGVIGSGTGLVVDSYGLISVCLDRQSAAAELGLDVGDAVVIEPGDDRGPAVAVTMRSGR